ncbi:MAG: hypothetical protein J3R72DRAFT_529277 [Linnemannia gamsii]|nr:MAG: hypothetical protein J3R72DRAFT_529277 [Linnemannia gamsii]
MATAITYQRSTRFARIVLLLIVLIALLSVVAVASPLTQKIRARQDDENLPSSADIEDSDPPAEQNSLDAVGETQPDPIESATATEMTPPILINKSTLLTAPALAPGASATKSSSPSSTVISGSNSTNIIIGADPRKAASRLSLTKPKPNQASPPLFALGNPIEFAWEFDNATLSIPPANLTLQVTLNTDATKIWPIANISGAATSFTWNTANIITPSNLLTGMYTLNIFDAKIGKLGVANGGQLMSNSDLRFGLYVPGSKFPGASKGICGTCEFATAMAPLQRQIPPFIIVGIASLVIVFS